MMRDLLTQPVVAGNELWRVLLFLGTVLASLVLGRLVRLVLERLARRPRDEKRAWFGVLLKCLAGPVLPLAFALGWWLLINGRILNLGPGARAVLQGFGSVLYAVTIGYAVYALVGVVDFVLQRWAERSASKVDDILVPLVGKSVRLTILVLVVVQVIQSLSDKPVTSILAGLGVGGLAVAMAGQDTIKNFFGSLVIVGDKPFEIGDRVVIDGHDGPVENVGFRSTKIRTLEGHLVTIPNSDIVNKTVRNVGKRPNIRRLATIGITYDTPPPKVEEAVAILRDILRDHEGMDPEFPPRVYFNGFGACSLDLMMLYWYAPPDYWNYMVFSEKVNLEILKRFNEAGIEFAFPTRTLYLANDERRQLALKLLREQT